LERTALQFSLDENPALIQYDPTGPALEWAQIPPIDHESDEHDEPIETSGIDDEKNGDDSDGNGSPQNGESSDTEPQEPESAASSVAAAAEPDQDEDGIEESDEETIDEIEDGAVWRMHSKKMRLHIRQPGQLRNQTDLDGTVEVEVRGSMFSGIEAALFDACGELRPRSAVNTKTKLRLDFRVSLEDEFNRRDVSATQALHFDEVIPTEHRIDDIRAALRDRGFDVKHWVTGDDANSPEWFITAERIEGPSRIRLLIVVRGRRFRTRRRATMPKWHRYTSKIDSGELRMSIYGEVPRNSRELTTEINELRQSLTSRFQHVKAQR
jgi:hypothetical protein